MNTYFALMAEFETAQIPLKECCDKYFGMSYKEACRRAVTQNLPVPVFRCGSSRSGWLIDIRDLIDLLDRKREEASNDWKRMNS